MMTAATPMEGDGAYNRNSSWQTSLNRPVIESTHNGLPPRIGARSCPTERANFAQADGWS
jgi:hypothetical protein